MGTDHWLTSQGWTSDLPSSTTFQSGGFQFRGRESCSETKQTLTAHCAPMDSPRQGRRNHVLEAMVGVLHMRDNHKHSGARPARVRCVAWVVHRCAGRLGCCPLASAGWQTAESRKAAHGLAWLQGVLSFHSRFRSTDSMCSALSRTCRVGEWVKRSEREPDVHAPACLAPANI